MLFPTPPRAIETDGLMAYPTYETLTNVSGPLHRYCAKEPGAPWAIRANEFTAIL